MRTYEDLNEDERKLFWLLMESTAWSRTASTLIFNSGTVSIEVVMRMIRLQKLEKEKDEEIKNMLKSERVFKAKQMGKQSGKTRKENTERIKLRLSETIKGLKTTNSNWNKLSEAVKKDEVEHEFRAKYKNEKPLKDRTLRKHLNSIWKKGY